MASIMKDLGIDRLTVDERLDLMHEIWESVSDEARHGQLNAAQRRELETRLAENRASPDDVVPWEQIKTEALNRFER